ncbi:MAG: hypothetical protein JO021_06825 [Alphaproteobacteria bacterium]|nr:hypothetical protein [Alphaproteobacteria bacterium]
MERVDQAFWQLFHAVEDRLSEIDLADLKPAAAPSSGAVAVDLNGPPHALGVLRREAERRGVACEALIATLSEERRGDLPEWWLALARTRAIGAPPA